MLASASVTRYSVAPDTQAGRLGLQGADSHVAWPLTPQRHACRPPLRLIIKSVTTPDEYYVGVTSDVALRLRDHNAGLSRHTSHHRPWRTLVVIEFDEEQPALKFERYLKSGSEREFARRHFRKTVGAAKRAKGDARL